MNEKKQEKKQENNFKFGVYLVKEKSPIGKVIATEPVIETIFSADRYNPVVRYSVNIREMIPNIISTIQTVLQTESENLTFVNKFGNNTLDFYIKAYEINKLEQYKLKVPSPLPRYNPATGKTYAPKAGGTEFQFGLYINANPIVERNFYVDNYNPESRFSNEFGSDVNSIVKKLKAHLKRTDIYQMWDDWLIINVYETNIDQVRKLSKEKREELLKKTGDYSFVERVRADYSKQQQMQQQQEKETAA